MSRRSASIRQEVHPDSRYNDRQVTRFINVVMSKGKRSIAERIFYGALDLVKEKTGNDPFKVFKQAVENVRPVVEVMRNGDGLPLETPRIVDLNTNPLLYIVSSLSLEAPVAAAAANGHHE